MHPGAVRLAGCGLALLSVALGRIALAEQTPPYVYPVNYPLAYFAARLSDGSVLVLYPKIRGEPSSWRPGPADLDDMRRAALVFLNGAGGESWKAADVVAPARRIDTTAGLGAALPGTMDAERPWLLPLAAGRSPAVASWLDLSLAIGQAAAVKRALLAARLGDRLALEANFAELEAELTALDRRLMAAAGDSAPVPVIAASPGYDYLAWRYPFSLRSLDWSGDGIPSETKMLELDHLLEVHPAKPMLWPEMPDWPLRQRLEELGLVLVVMPTLERWPRTGDFASVMRDNVERLLQALAEAE